MLALCGGVALFLVSFLGNRLDADTGLSAQVFAYLNLFDHMDDFARGVLDSRAVVLFGTLTVSFLFLTLRVVESRRWR
jgi:ABC-2 type transport system permease protein